MLNGLDPAAMVAIAVALGLGGLVKGATGAGAPLIAVPVMAGFYDVKLAIVLMVIPNLVNNAVQTWTYRDRIGGMARIGPLMAAASIPGIFIGTALLSRLSPEALSAGMAAILAAYLCLRLVDPTFALAPGTGAWLSAPVGLVAGILQGAAGMSGPLALLFLSTLRMERPDFVATISIFFLTGALTQAPALWHQGLLTWPVLLLGVVALVPVSVGLQVGDRVARRADPATFNRLVLVLIALLAARLAWKAIA